MNDQGFDGAKGAERTEDKRQLATISSVLTPYCLLFRPSSLPSLLGDSIVASTDKL